MRPPKLTKEQKEQQRKHRQWMQKRSYKARLEKYGKEGLSKMMSNAAKKRWKLAKAQ